MNGVDHPIYLGSILLEPNRWATGKVPSYRVSDWLDRARADGFDGLELWEYHATLCSTDELAALEARAAPLAVYNTYAGFAADGAAARRQAAELCHRLRAGAAKFNVGADPAAEDEYRANVLAWAAALPADTRLLCECHPGTVAETPAGAAPLFAAWPDDRVQAIVHPFWREPGRLAEWLQILGPRITHAHVQLRSDSGTFLCLDEDAAFAVEALRVLRDGGFRGSLTLEFTKGTRTPDDHPEALYQAALRDLAFLREHLA